MMTLTRKSTSLNKIINNTLWDLPSPSSITYFWNFGSILGICLVTQIVTGLLLTFHYTSHAPETFNSIMLIIRETWSGWVLRFMHINGASVFFLFMYLHLFRGMFYFRSTHKKVWLRGTAIIIILIAISFLGYVLPWGQISYWAVAVITNLFSVVPIIGTNLVTWIWGGFSVRRPTLTRFYSLHFLLPFVLAALVLMHLVYLHEQGSRNALGLNRNIDKIEFHPYFSVKDLRFIIVALSLALAVTFYYPYILGDVVNNIPANAIQTPLHIQPEWYFLTSYAILRALPRKTAGVVALAISVLIFLFMPLYKIKFSTKFRKIRTLLYWFIVSSFLALIKMGARPAEEPYILVSQVFSFLYLSFILILNV